MPPVDERVSPGSRRPGEQPRLAGKPWGQRAWGYVRPPGLPRLL